jgi:protein translocase SecG subunit
MDINTLKTIEIVISIILILLILIQTKSNNFSSSLSSRFSFQRTKRGLESFVFYLTIVLSIGFSVNTILLVLLNK